MLTDKSWWFNRKKKHTLFKRKTKWKAIRQRRSFSIERLSEKL